MQPKKYETYTKKKLLGEGSFGKAYLVECNSDKALCVIKEVDISKMSEHERAETRQEAKILALLKHPCIVNFREVYTTVSNKLCIVMDFADGGDLQKKIKDNRGKLFSEAQVLDWFTQICLGMKHVHDRKILHRDIKAQNVFLTSTNRCLLGDFGIARVLKNTKGFAKTMVGTPYYLSPEIIESKHYGFKSDIWSLGVLLYELCALKPPFDAPSLHFLAMKIVKGSYPPLPSQYSRELKNLITQMLTIDPNKRPTIHQILGSSIIKARVKTFLSEAVYSAEFSHTILHNVNVLDNKENKAVSPAIVPPPVASKEGKSPLAPPMRSPMAGKGAPLPSARGNNNNYGRLMIPAPPQPVFAAAHGVNKDRELERMRIERERIFRIKEKEAAEKKRQEELERNKRAEELEKKRLEDEKRRVEEEKRRASEERKKQERIKEEFALKNPSKLVAPLVPRTPRVGSEEPGLGLLNRPKFNPGVIVAPIQQPIVTKNSRINQIKANFDRQIGLLKGEKKPEKPAKKGKSDEDEKLEQVEEARKTKAKEREEQRRKMRDDIKEQRKKISPSKLDPEIQWVSASERKEHPAPTSVPLTPDGCKKIDLALNPPLVSAREPEEEKKPKKSGKTKVKSKKKKSMKKAKEEPPMPVPQKIISEPEENKVRLSKDAAGDIAKAQKEINNYMLLRKEMEQIMNCEEAAKTPGGEDEDCAGGDLMPAVKCSQENCEKDEGRDDVAGVLEEEKGAGKTPLPPTTPTGENGVARTLEKGTAKVEDEKEVVKAYLDTRFGKENVRCILAGIRRLLKEETGMMGIETYYKDLGAYISREELAGSVGLFVTLASQQP